MNYLSMLTEDEARYICSVIPYEHTINYFQQNPKEFAKIRPGFRAKAISKSDASRLLFNYRNRRFVSVFICFLQVIFPKSCKYFSIVLQLENP